MHRTIFWTVAALGLAACAPAAVKDTAAPPAAEAPAEAAEAAWTFDDGVIFPADRSLTRPESGVVLADGTVLVVDQVNGLTAISPNGATRPYGNFAAAGFTHLPPDNPSGPNGAAFEPDRRHLLIADVFTGALWRTDTQTETTKKIYQHPFGINYAHRDSTGALWFTQSTENAPPGSETRLFAALDMPLTDGKLLRIAPVADGALPEAPEEILTGLQFANGFAIDESRGKLFIAETVGGHVLSFTVDLATGALSDRAVLSPVTTPDNVEQAEDGMLWVASPMANQVLEINPDTGETRVAFSAQTELGAAALAEFKRRSETGEPRAALLGPDVWSPMPGLVTGVIHTPGGGPAYVSGLGDALLKIED